MTVFQQTFFNIHSAEDIIYRKNIEVKLTSMAEALGVEFKETKRRK